MYNYINKNPYEIIVDDFIAEYILVIKGWNIFIEAESFDNKGGWVLDNQSMKQMGSSYLLAHGLGIPVKMLQQSSKLRIRENTEFGSEHEIGLRNGIRQPLPDVSKYYWMEKHWKKHLEQKQLSGIGRMVGLSH